ETKRAMAARAWLVRRVRGQVRAVKCRRLRHWRHRLHGWEYSPHRLAVYKLISLAHVPAMLRPVPAAQLAPRLRPTQGLLQDQAAHSRFRQARLMKRRELRGRTVRFSYVTPQDAIDR